MQPHSSQVSNGNIPRYITIAIALVALAIVLWRISGVLVIGFGGVVLAAMLRALAVPLCRRTGWGERWCVLIVVLVLVVVFAAMCWLFGQQATTETHELREQFPVAVGKLDKLIERYDVGKRLVAGVHEATVSARTLTGVSLAAGAVLEAIADLILILFLSVYFAVDPQLYCSGLLRLLPPKHRPRVGRALDDAGDALQKWLVAQAIAMITVGILVGIGLAMVGVPFASALGVIAALLEFVPVLGPILFSIPGLLLSFARGPKTMLYALIVYLVVQQLESNILIPLLQRWAVKLPPVLGLLAIVIGGLLLGVPGVVFATPLAMVVLRLVQHLYVEDTLENGRSNVSPKIQVTAK